MHHLRTATFLLLAALCASACNQPTEGARRKAEAFWDGGPPKVKRFQGEEVYTDGEWLKDGPVEFFDQEGRLTHRGEYRLGLESGIWIEFDSAGRKTGEGRYLEGQRDGDWAYYYASGNEQERGKYERGTRVGLWTQWYSNGAKMAEKTMAEGEINGEVRVWLPDGTLDQESSGTYAKGAKVAELGG